MDKKQSTNLKGTPMLKKEIPLSEPEKLNEEKLSFREKIRQWYQRLPDKKRYLEFITALLTIPVLLTVIISNIQSLQKQKQTEVPSSPTPSVFFDNRPMPREPKDMDAPSPTAMVTSTPSVTPSARCIKEVGPISIVYPEEGSTTSKNPLCLDISRTGVDYCSVVWSYRINGGNWSDYTDKSICMYGLTSGTKNLELRVKSIVTGDEIILTRTFTFEGTATPTPTSSSSASLNN